MANSRAEVVKVEDKPETSYPENEKVLKKHKQKQTKQNTHQKDIGLLYRLPLAKSVTI